MKKVLFGLFALSCISMAAETNLYFRTGADIGGKFEVIKDEDGDYNKKDADDFAWEIAIEATKEVYQGLELGLGVAYQDHGKPKKYVEVEDKTTVVDYWVDEYEMKGYTSIPLYLTAKYNFKPINNFVPYVKANIGYSFNDSKDDFKFGGCQYNSQTDEFLDSGYDTADTKVKNGLYCGIGGGFEYNNFTVDLMYQLNKAKAEMTFSDAKGNTTYELKDDFDYSRVTLSFGYRFNLNF